MKHIGLFAGIGGFELAARWAGWETIAWCEIDKFCQTVLKYHFPNAIGYEDIRTTDFTIYRGQCDVLTGGFPCQPFSVAGKRKGTEDNRFLWPEMLRAIREIKPSWVVAENVYGLVNQQRGLVFKRVLTEMDALGYEVQPFIIPACAVGAPHRRDRVWIVANRTNTGVEILRSEREDSILSNSIITNSNCSGWNERRTNCDWKTENSEIRDGIFSKLERLGFKPTITNTDIQGFEIVKCKRENNESKFQAIERNSNRWERWPTQSPICNRNDGVSFGLAGITFPRWRKESIKGLGNAIVPQVAYEIFKVINKLKN